MKTGEKIPEILGRDQNGREIKASDYAGRKLVLYDRVDEVHQSLLNVLVDRKINNDTHQSTKAGEHRGLGEKLHEDPFLLGADGLLQADFCGTLGDGYQQDRKSVV